MNDKISDFRVICQECDLLVRIGHLPEGYRASCPRCGSIFTRAFSNALDRMLIFALTALICLVFSNLFSYVNLLVQGQERQISLLETVQVLFELKEWALSAFMLVIIIGLPAFFTALISWLAIAIKLERVSPHTIKLMRFIGYVRFWNMAEIFFLGILISMVKVASLAHIEVGPSFWAYAFFNIFFIAALSHYDKFQLAMAIRRIVNEKQAAAHAV